MTAFGRHFMVLVWARGLIFEMVRKASAYLPIVGQYSLQAWTRRWHRWRLFIHYTPFPGCYESGYLSSA